MGRGGGKAIVEGSDVSMDIFYLRKSKGVVHSDVYKSFLDVVGEVEVDEDYKMYLLEVLDLLDQGDENEVNNDAQEEDYDPHYKLFFENLKPQGNAYVLEIARKNGNIVIKYEDKDDDKYQSPNETRRKSLRKTRRHFVRKDADSSDQKVKPGARNDKIMEEYSMFLSHLSIVGESFVFVDENGNRIRYGESTNESSSDSEPKRSAKRPRVDNEKTLSARKEALGLCDEVAPLDQKRVASPSSGFRQGVLGVLEKPYDRKEHLHLLKQAEEKKPIRRYRETRNKIFSFEDEEELGKSYLDHHYDLKEKINAAKRNNSRHEVLYLLRGLFFYLEHVAEDGQFWPWRDDEWLGEMKRKVQERV